MIPKFLYKYVCPNTAQIILENKSIRYTSLPDLNDALETVPPFKIPDPTNNLKPIFIRKFKELVDDNRKIPKNFKYKKLIEAITVLKAPYKDYIENCPMFEENFIHQYERIIIQTNKILNHHTTVLCLTEDPHNNAMWGTYGKSFSGVVLGFNTNLDSESLFTLAKPVIYQNEQYDLFTVEEAVDSMLKIKKIDIGSRTLKAGLIKSNHWKHEKEWRIVYKNIESSGSEIINILPNELSKIILGNKISKENEDKVISLAKNWKTEVEIFKIVQDGYLLKSSPI